MDVIEKEIDVTQNLIMSMTFFLILTVRGLFHRKYLTLS